MCLAIGKHPNVLLREGWSVEEINELAALWLLKQEAQAAAYEEG